MLLDPPRAGDNSRPIACRDSCGSSKGEWEPRVREEVVGDVGGEKRYRWTGEAIVAAFH